MSENKKIIPFHFWPYSWGMKGKTREIAEAEYYLTGYELDKKLLGIHRDIGNEDDYKRKLYDLKLKYNVITRDEYNRLLIGLIKDEKQKELAEIELDLRDGKVTQIEYEKKCATLKKEPWVSILAVDFTMKSSQEGSFELDWNEFFIEKLKKEGYAAVSDDLIVNQWFLEVCRNVAMEEYNGTGTFTEDSESNLEAAKSWNPDVLPGRKGYQ